jgi:hypothetical protein
MADMTERYFSEKEIDDIVISQADDDSAWDESIQIHRISIPPDFADVLSSLKLHGKGIRKGK